MLRTRNVTHKANKMNAEIYFGIVGPPSSAFPKNDKDLLRHMRASPRVATTVYRKILKKEKLLVSKSSGQLSILHHQPEN